MNKEALNAAIAEEFEIDVKSITPEAKMKEVLELDSLSLLDLVIVVENVTGVKIKGTEVSHLVTFEDMYNFLEEQCS